MKYADLHSDTLTLGRYLPESEKGKNFILRDFAQISLDKLKKGDCALQCFALFSRSAKGGAWEQALPFLDEYKRRESEILAAGIKPVLTIEDGGLVENDLSRVQYLLDFGVKIFGITWNDENCLGYPCGGRGGLKPFGKTAAEYLMQKGVYPDVSHLSDDGVFDLLEMAKCLRFPVVATHSLCRSVHPHRRNLTDEQIEKIADLGGVVGVNFAPDFIGEKGIVAHILHLLKVGGEDVLAIGTDFDGIQNPVYPSAEKMPQFFDDLSRAGLPSRIIEKLALKNVQRLL